MTSPEVTIVSRYWTPDHLDVTWVPITYARPKAAWIDRFEELRKRMTSDTRDRMLRRRMQSHAIVQDPGDLTGAPPLPKVATIEKRRLWLGWAG